MKDSYMISNETGRKLYGQVKDLPIIDYHCHLSPREIYEDEPFSNVGQVMLGGDHYKWRVMRAAGIEEKRVTGSASWHDKFLAYAEALELAAGNPVAQWTRMELDAFFGVTEDLNRGSAERIWNACNAVIKREKMSPRKVMEKMRVQFVATTDDPADSLAYHIALADDPGMKTRVAPSYRPDAALNLQAPGYPAYIVRLSQAAGMEIKDLASLKQALCARLDFFKENGCRVTDIGLEAFPDKIGTDEEAEAALRTALAGGKPDDALYRAFLGNLYVFLGREYAKRGLIMQLHVAVTRSANTKLLQTVGADVGGDTMGTIDPKDLIRVLDAIEMAGGLPKTVLYAMNPSLTPAMSAIAGSFPGVIVGAAWWMLGHKRGIREVVEIISETGYIGSFLGMLTDSRSFFSYPRHDYFRRIFCSLVGEWVEADEYPYEYAQRLVYAVCCGNVKKAMLE